MRGEVPRLFIGINKSCLPATFTVNPVKDERPEDCPMNDDIKEPMFEGDQSLASILFGWAVARLLMEWNRDVILLFNQDENIVFPDGNKFRDL